MLCRASQRFLAHIDCVTFRQPLASFLSIPELNTCHRLCANCIRRCIARLAFSSLQNVCSSPKPSSPLDFCVLKLFSIVHLRPPPSADTEPSAIYLDKSWIWNLWMRATRRFHRFANEAWEKKRGRRFDRRPCQHLGKECFKKTCAGFR